MIALGAWCVGVLVAAYAFGRWVEEPPELRWIFPMGVIAVMGLLLTLLLVALRTNGQ